MPILDEIDLLSDSLNAVWLRAISETDQVWAARMGGVSTREALMAVTPGVLESHGAAAGVVGAEWFGAVRPPGLPGFVPVSGVWGGNEALLREMIGRVLDPVFQEFPDFVAARSMFNGEMLQQVFDVGRDTVIDNTRLDRSARGWYRVAHLDACTFCLMLADRGPVYTEHSSRFAAHPHCRCEAVPVWDGEQRLTVREYEKSLRERSPEELSRTYEYLRKHYGVG